MEGFLNSSEKRCAVVTGGNKGIGFEICKQLASNGIYVILTARDEKRGTEAVERLKESGFSDVIFHQLDITDSSSILCLTDFLTTHFEKLDILANNAGDLGVIVNGDVLRAIPRGIFGVRDEDSEMVKKIMEQNYERAEECFNTNYYGSKALTESLLPLLQLSGSANIVNVSSTLGQLLSIQNEQVKKKLHDVESLTEECIHKILQAYLKDCEEGKLGTNGWPNILSAYKLSKAALNAYTRLLARKFPNIRINASHPGYVKTDITCHTGFLTAEEGAKGPVMVALFDVDGPSGQLFDEMEVSVF